MKRNNKNKVVNQIDVLKNELDKIDMELMETQRKQDLKVDIINKKFENKRDYLLRQKQFIEMQMKQAHEYAKTNLSVGGVNE